MKPAAYVAIGAVAGAIIMWLMLINVPTPPDPRVQTLLDSLGHQEVFYKDLLTRKEQALVDMGRQYDSIVALDNTGVIYLRAHEHWKGNRSVDSALGFLTTRPTALWEAAYPGRDSVEQGQ